MATSPMDHGCWSSPNDMNLDSSIGWNNSAQNNTTQSRSWNINANNNVT